MSKIETPRKNTPESDKSKISNTQDINEVGNSKESSSPTTTIKGDASEALNNESSVPESSSSNGEIFNNVSTKITSTKGDNLTRVVTSKITSIGGQALMEGIMMVGPNRTTAAFCDENGVITTEDIEFTPITKRFPILGKPFLRGIFSMIDSFKRGYKALTLSADKMGLDEEDEEASGFDKWLLEKFGDKITPIIMGVASILGIGLAILLFFFTPTILFNLISRAAGGSIDWMRSIFEGLLRMTIFVLYLFLMSFIPDIRRTFMYHGAEHKSISTYEANDPLTVENVRKHTRFHPRCGTSFMVEVLIISIIVGFFIPFSNPLLRTIAKLLCIPLITSVGYEIFRIIGRHPNKFFSILAAPGLWVQRITTKEPDDKMIEAAIEALNAVIPENGEDLIS